MHGCRWGGGGWVTAKIILDGKIQNNPGCHGLGSNKPSRRREGGRALLLSGSCREEGTHRFCSPGCLQGSDHYAFRLHCHSFHSQSTFLTCAFANDTFPASQTWLILLQTLHSTLIASRVNQPPCHLSLTYLP